jgi:diguanylate cyclase (GGDEF)-like protein/PAS domain S-box-containing protein
LQSCFTGQCGQAVDKVIIRQGVQKFQVQGARKVQGRSVVSLRESLNFLKQRRNWKIFNALWGSCGEPQLEAVRLVGLASVRIIPNCTMGSWSNKLNGLWKISNMEWNIYSDHHDERCDVEKTKSELIDELHWARNKISRLEEHVECAGESSSQKTGFLWHVLHNASIAYQALDAEAKLIDVNDVWLTTLGYARNEVVGKSFKDFFSEECANNVIAKNHKTLDFNWLNGTEIMLLNKNGGLNYFILSCYIVYNEKRSISKIHCILQNISTQKEIINVLIDRKRKYKLMLDNVHDIVWTHDMQGNYTFVTPSIFNVTGYTQEEALQQNYTDHMPENEKQIANEFISQVNPENEDANQENQVNRVEARLIRKDGSMFWGEVITSPLWDENGAIIGFQGVTRDITERKEMEENLRRKERFLNAVLESVQDGINIIDPDLNICRANDVMRRWAASDGPIEGRKCYKVYHNTSQPCSPCSAISCFFSGKTEYTECPGPVHSQVHWIEVASHPMRDPDSGHVEYIVEFVRDVTQRKKAEEALRESERQFRQLFEQATMGIFQSDFNHNIVKANHKACELLGYSCDELLGMNALEIIHPDDLRERPLQKNLNKLHSGETLEIERRFCRGDGTYINVLVSLGRLGLQEKNISHIIMFQDISDRKHMEEKLQKMSFHDTLTGLYNRNYFEEEMSRLGISRYSPIGIMICDLDGLKFINDTLGHQAGDQMLIQVADILRQSFRTGDILARIGGDEFAVLLEETDAETMEQLLQRLRRAVREYNNTGPEIPLSLSLGQALGEGEAIDMHAVFREADNRMYREKIQREESARNAIIQALSKSMQARDFKTEGHCDRLQDLCVSLARSLNLSQDLVNDLTLLARFHDLGKVGVGDHILYKPGALTEDEWRQMRQHCEIGQRIASSVPDLQPIAELILKHHERWDGKGYPLGISGRDIPLPCRILAIVDAYDAMTSDRPYRKAMSKQKAVQELRRCARTQFDPDLVERFIQVVTFQNGD